MKNKNYALTITFNEETSLLLKETFSNLKEYSWKDLSFLKKIIEGDLSMKIPLTVGVPAEKKPVYKNSFSMLILKNIGDYSRKKIPSFLCKDMNFDEVTLWSFNVTRGREPILYSEVNSFQSSANTDFNQEEETKYFEDALSFPFIYKNKKYYQAINLATFLFLNEFYFVDNPMFLSLATLFKPRYLKLFKNREDLEKLIFLCKYIRKEARRIDKKVLLKNIETIYNSKILLNKKKHNIFSIKVSKNLQFLRDFELSFFEKKEKIVAEVLFRNESELLFFKNKKIVEKKIYEILFQYVFYGKLVKEISDTFFIEESTL
jgi:hypothetical protein